MADGVRGQLVDGQDHVGNPVVGKPCLEGASPELDPQHSEPAGIEPHINDRRPAGVRRFRLPLIDPTVTTARSS